MTTPFSDQLKAIGNQAIESAPVSQRRSLFTRPENLEIQNLNQELGPNQQFETDKQLLSPSAFIARYGADAEKARRFQNKNDYADPIRRDEVRDVNRTRGEVTADSLKSFYGGLWQGGAGIVNLGARGLDLAARSRNIGGKNILWDNPAFMRETSEIADSIAEDAADGSSRSILNKQRIAEVEKAPRLADSKITYDQSGKDFADKLRKIGRDSLIQGQSFVENPAVAGDTVSNAAGSLVPSLVGSGGTTAIARGVLGTGTKLADTGTRLVTAATVGGIEGQGAYNSTVVEVNKFTENQLNQNSDDYRALRAEGLSHEDARAEVAHLAGNKAQKIQTGIAAVAGYGVAKFEGNPLAAGSLIKTLGSQTVEEAVQSATGQLSSNRGIKEFADSSRDTTEGVGQALTEGALGGLGATGVITSPQAVAKATDAVITTAKTAAPIVMSQIEKIAEKRIADLEAKADKDNPTGNVATSTRINGLEKIIKDTVTNIKPDNPLNKSLPVELLDTVSDDYVSRVGNLSNDIVAGSRIKTIRRIAEKIRRGQYNTPEQIAEATAFVRSEVEALRTYVSEQQSDEAKPTSVGDAVARIVSSVLENKAFTLPEVTEEVNTASEAFENVSPDLATIKEVIVSPVSVDPTRVSNSLASEYNGTPAETAAFKVAAAIAPIKQNEPSDGSKKTRADVRNELVFSDENISYGSMSSFNELVSNAIKGGIKQERAGNTEVIDSRGDPVDAKDSVIRLGNLAQHQINKFNAATESINQSAANPGAETNIKYETLDPRTGDRFFPIERGNDIFINPRSEESVETYRQVREDANLGITAYNAVLENFGDIYTGTKLELLPEIDNAIIERARRDAATETKVTQENNTTSQETAAEKETPIQLASKDGRTNDNNLDTGSTNQSQLRSDIRNAKTRSLSDLPAGTTGAEALARLNDFWGKARESMLDSEYLEAAVRALSDAGIDGLKVIGEGAERVVFSSSSRKGVVVKIGTKQQEFRDSDAVLNPLFADSFGDLYVEVYPKANVIVDPVETKAGKDKLAERGYIMTDPGKGNLGSIDGKIFIIDGQAWKKGTKDKDGVIITPPKLGGPITPQLNQSTESKPEATAEQKTKAATKDVEDPTALSPSLLTPQVSTARNDEKAVGLGLASTIVEETFEKLSPQVSANEDLLEKINDSFEEGILPEDEIVLNNYFDYVINVAKGISSKVQNDLSKRIYTTPQGPKTWLEVLEDGSIDLTRQRDGRALGLLTRESIDAGKPQFDEHLLNLAVIAALDYALNEDTSGGFKDIKDANKLLGLVEDAIPTREQLYALNFGKAEFHVKEELGRAILNFWGASIDVNQSTSFTKGISEAIADEILGYFDGAKESLFETLKTDVGVGKDKRSYVSTRINKDQIKKLGSLSSSLMLRDVLAPELDTKKYVIGEKPSLARVPDTQKKNKNVLVGENQRKAIKRQQETPSFRAERFIEDVQFLAGENNDGAPLAQYLGFQEIGNIDNYNAFDLETIKGKNRSIEKNIQDVFDLLSAIENHPDENPATYFTYFTSSNNRYFQEGPNQQTNKLLREAVIPNAQEVDITPGSKSLEALYAAIAQAFGEKIENLGLKASAAKAESLIDGKYRNVIDAFRAGDNKAFIEAISVGGFEQSAKELKAISTIVRLEDAQAAGETSLKSELSLEIDAKTNGPISAFFQNSLDGFGEAFIAMAARGGLYFGDVAKDYSEYAGSESAADYYEIVASEQTSEVRKLNSEIRDNNPNKKELLGTQVAILSLLNELGGITFSRGVSEIDENGRRKTSDGALVINRKGTKGPITQQVYGAGNKSIAAGLSKSILKSVLEEATAVLQGADKEQLSMLIAAVNKITEVELTNTEKDASQWGATQSNVRISVNIEDKAQLRNMLFDKEVYDVLTKNIEALYVQPFSSALSNVTGSRTGSSLKLTGQREAYESSLKNLLKDFQGNSYEALKFTGLNSILVSASGAHTDIYLSVLNNFVNTATEKYRAKNGKGLELPTAELNKILASAQKFAPIYDNGEASFQLGSLISETTNEVDARRAQQPKNNKESTFGPRSGRVDGSKSSSRRRVPSTAGVSILPNNVISNADVKIITDVMNGIKENTGVIAVHDGIETGINDIAEVSLLANKAALDSFQTNTIKPVLDSLKSLKELQVVAEARGANSKMFSEIDAAIELLDAASNIRDARIAALATVRKSSDAVPGAQSPYFEAEGKVFTNEQDLIDHLNSEMQLALTKQTQKAVAEKKLSLDDSIEIEPEGGSELRTQLKETSDAREFIEVLGNNITNTDQKRVFSEIKASPALQDMLDANLTIVLSPPSDTGGRYDMTTNTIYVSNATTETALHELIHAATAYQVADHYNAPETTSERGKAISRLESLMYDFVGRTYTKGSVEALVQSEIQAGLKKNNATGKIEALNEFMAWSLSNERLINKAKNKIANDPLSQARALGSKAIRMMRRILGFSSNKAFDHILFNTVIILNSDQTISKTPQDNLRQAIFRQRMRKSNDGVFSDEATRRAELQKLLDEQFKIYMQKPWEIVDGIENKLRDEVVLDTDILTSEALHRMMAAGFEFNTIEEVNLFKSLTAIFSLDFFTNKVARLEAQKLYEAVTDKITPETFLKQMGTDYINATEAQTIRANNMHAAIVGLQFENPKKLGTFLEPGTDQKGLSDRLGVFMAMSQTSESFRSLMADIPFEDLGLDQTFEKDSLDGAIESLTRFSLMSLTSKVLNPSGDKTKVNTQEALDVLSHLLVGFDAEAATALETKTSSRFRQANKATASAIEKVGKTISDTAQALDDKVQNSNQSPALKALAGIPLQVASSLSDFLVPSRSKAQADGITSILNNDKIPVAFRELWSEIRGRTEDTAGVYDLVKRAKQHVSSVREEYREKLPKIFAAQFSDKFNERGPNETRKEAKARQERDWSFMHRGFGRTDFSVLTAAFGESRALRLFGASDAKKAVRQKAIKGAMQDVERNASKLGLPKEVAKRVVKIYGEKAAQLGFFLASDIPGENLLRSAEAIAGLYNENELGLTQADYEILQKAVISMRNPETNASFTYNQDYRALIKSIDVLASVYAVDNLSPAVTGRLEYLVNNELSGVRYVLSYAEDLRKREAAKTDHTGARINGYKGHLNTTTRPRYSLIVAPNSDHDALIKAGYTRLRDYEGPESVVNKSHKAQGYYFSASAGLANYNQGALQTVQQSYNGVHPSTGLTQGPTTAGVIKGDYAKNLNRKLKRSAQANTKDGLLPVFTEYGDLIGFERSLAPDMVDLLDRTDHFGKSLANWSGRIVEEQAATGLNQALIDQLFEAWDQREFNTDDQFVEFSDESEALKEDKIWQDNYRLIPKDVREYAKNKFNGPLMIRKDMINNALGYRSASVGDIFETHESITDRRKNEETIGRLRAVQANRRLNAKQKATLDEAIALRNSNKFYGTRVNEPTRKAAETIAIAIFGPKARKYLTNVEGVTQTVISEVKHTIVVKSVVILGANTVSNVMQLAGREVPLSYMAKRTKSKYAEVAQFKRNEELKIKLRADLLAARTKEEKARINNKLETIEESEKRMSIWPLIEAGEFTTISEGLTDADRALMDGRFIDWLEGKAADLPSGLSTVARYAMVSRDTALYQGLARGVQYSDFIAKAVYYDFLTENRGSSKAEALAKVTEEFINYDLADGRTRSYLESIGLTWFLNFKIRSAKIAIDLARNNPLSALFTIGGAGMAGLDVGSAITDNAFAAWLDGRLAYSIGPGMVEAGWNLNLWNQIFGR